MTMYMHKYFLYNFYDTKILNLFQDYYYFVTRIKLAMRTLKHNTAWIKLQGIAATNTIIIVILSIFITTVSLLIIGRGDFDFNHNADGSF